MIALVDLAQHTLLSQKSVGFEQLHLCRVRLLARVRQLAHLVVGKSAGVIFLTEADICLESCLRTGLARPDAPFMGPGRGCCLVDPSSQLGCC